MAGRVDEVDEEARAILALLDEVQVVLRELIEEGDGPVGAGDISPDTVTDEATPGPTASLTARLRQIYWRNAPTSAVGPLGVNTRGS